MCPRQRRSSHLMQLLWCKRWFVMGTRLCCHLVGSGQWGCKEPLLILCLWFLWLSWYICAISFISSKPICTDTANNFRNIYRSTFFYSPLLYVIKIKKQTIQCGTSSSCSTTAVHRGAEMTFKVIIQRGNIHHTVQTQLLIKYQKYSLIRSSNMPDFYNCRVVEKTYI